MTQESIEDRIKKMTDKHGCRVCHHFIRVNFDTVENVSHRQGFCVFGEFEGDYSLYYSKSASDCMGFLFSQSHSEMASAEINLTEKMQEFEASCRDKRTTNYKLIEPMFEETRKYIQAIGHKGFAAIAAMDEVKITANRYYRQSHDDEIRTVFRMVTLKKADYLKFLAKVAVKIHDEFCDCDKIEYKGDAK